MTRVPYVPMHAPKRVVSEERLAQVLAKHAKPKVQISISQTCLAWKKPVVSSDGTAFILSECGGYRIDRRENPRMYHAMTFGPEFRYELGRKATADEAKALCEAESRRRAARESVQPTGCGDGIGQEGR